MEPLLDLDKYLRYNPLTRRFDVMWWRRNVLPAWLTWDVTDQTGALTVAAAGTYTKPVHYQPAHGSAQGADGGFGSPFEIRKIMFVDSPSRTASSALTVDVTDASLGRKWSNRPIHIRNIAGTAQLPFRMREPYMIESRSSLMTQFAKLTAGTTLLRFAFAGALWHPWAPNIGADDSVILKTMIARYLERKKYITPYWLIPDDDISLTSLSSQVSYVKNGEDAHFEAFGMVAVSTGDFAVEITEVQERGTIANGTVAASCGVGTAQLPFLFPTPYLIKGGQRLRLTFTDLSAGQSNAIYFALFGRRISAPLRDVQNGSVAADLAIDAPVDIGNRMVPAPLPY